MKGPTYQPTSPFNSRVRRTFGLTCATILVPGEANGIAAKLNSPYVCVYADNNGLDLADLRRFNVILHCSIRLSHSVRGKPWSTLAKPAFKWFYIFVWPSLLNPVGMCVEELAGIC